MDADFLNDLEELGGDDQEEEHLVQDNYIMMEDDLASLDEEVEQDEEAEEDQKMGIDRYLLESIKLAEDVKSIAKILSSRTLSDLMEVRLYFYILQYIVN